MKLSFNNSGLMDVVRSRQILVLLAVSPLLSFSFFHFKVLFPNVTNLFYYRASPLLIFEYTVIIPICSVITGILLHNLIFKKSDVKSGKSNLNRKISMIGFPTILLSIFFCMGALSEDPFIPTPTGLLYFETWLPAYTIIYIAGKCYNVHVNLVEDSKALASGANPYRYSGNSFLIALTLSYGVILLSLPSIIISLLVSSQAEGESLFYLFFGLLPHVGLLIVVIIAAWVVYLVFSPFISKKMFLLGLGAYLLWPLASAHYYFNDHGVLVMERHHPDGEPSYQRELWPFGGKLIVRKLGSGTYRGIYYQNGEELVRSENGGHFRMHKESGPAKTLYYGNGGILVEEWYQYGGLHKADGPAVVIYYESGETKAQEWYVDGKPLISESPSGVEYFKGGGIKKQTWSKGGNYSSAVFLNRKTGPAVIDYFENGRIKQETWFLMDYLHRKTGPASVEYHKDGSVSIEQYYQYGKLHKDIGPAFVSYYDNGMVKMEQYFIEGIPHRDNNEPATTVYNPDGSIQSKAWFVDGKLDRKEEQASE